MKPVDTLRNSHVQLVPLKWLNTYEHVVSMPRTKFQLLDMLPQELVQMVMPCMQNIGHSIRQCVVNV
jgi:hypothetical protein